MAYQPVPAASDPEPAGLARIIREIETKVSGEIARNTGGAPPLNARFDIQVPLSLNQKVSGFQITITKAGGKILTASLEIRDAVTNALLAATADVGNLWESPGVFPAALPSAFTAPRTDVFTIAMQVTAKGQLPVVTGNWATVV
jgi:hypothetical protein